MKIAMESRVAYEDWIRKPKDILDQVDALGEVVIVRNNQPAYHITACGERKAPGLQDIQTHKPQPGPSPQRPVMTLKEAARAVLETAESDQMHVSELADLIYEKGLYLKKDGSKAPYTQVRAMCGQYPEDFETLEKNRIRLVRKNT